MRIKSRTSLYVLAAVALIAATWIVASSLIRQDRTQRLEDAEVRAAELTAFFESEALKVLAIADTMVREVRYQHLNGGTLQSNSNLEGVAPARNDYVSQIIVIGADGQILSDSNGGTRATALSDAPFFKELQSATGDDVVLTRPVVSAATGRQSIGLGRPIRAGDGTFAGAVVAFINAGEFLDFFSTLSIGPNSTAMMVGADQKIRVSSSYTTEGPGADTSDQPLWRHVGHRSIDTFRQPSVDGASARIIAYRVMTDYPLLVQISLSEADYVAQSKSFSRPALFIAGLISAVVLTLLTMLAYADVAQRRLHRQIAVRRAAEQNLEAANINLAQFAYAASHDLKAPVSSIKGLLEFCLEDLENGDTDEVTQNLNEAIDISDRAAEKVESLLNLAKAGNDATETEKFSLSEMVQDIWVDQSSNLDCQCQLSVDIKGPDIIQTEKATFQVILENLISNAIRYRDYGKEKTQIAVRAHIKAGTSSIIVADNGVGIAEKDQGKVFEMFTRADDRSGHGLGLALVRKHIERLGAKISLSSQLGEGTEFNLHFKGLTEART